MLTNFLSYINGSDRAVGQIPGIVYMVGASFEFTGLDYHSEGPRLVGWLTMYLAQKGFMLVTDGKPGDSFNNYVNYIDTQVNRRTTQGITDKLDACIIGLTGQAVSDTSFTAIATAVSLIPKLKTISDTVIALDFPPMGDRPVPYIRDYLGVDQYWWDKVWIPKYRTDMQNAGAVVVNAHYDWEPNNRMETIGMPPGIPAWHITSVSARRAAKRIFNYLMSNTSLSTK